MGFLMFDLDHLLKFKLQKKTGRSKVNLGSDCEKNVKFWLNKIKIH